MPGGVKARTLILVIVVVAILIVGYYVFIGTKKPYEHVGPTSDPTGQGRQPIAYATLALTLNIHNNIWGGYKCTIEDFSADVHKYVGTPQQFYYWEKLGLFGHDDIGVKFEVQITGPNNWVTPTPWKVDDMIECGEGDHKVLTWNNGYSEFWDPGSYTAQIQVWLKGQDTGHEWALKATSTETFQVSG